MVVEVAICLHKCLKSKAPGCGGGVKFCYYCGCCRVKKNQKIPLCDSTVVDLLFLSLNLQNIFFKLERTLMKIQPKFEIV